MQILLIGASGMIGSRIVAGAARRGHSVVGVARRPENIASGDLVRAERADARDKEQIASLAKEVDVIVSAASPRDGGDPVSQALGVATALVDLAMAEGKRLVVVGGAGSLNLPDGRPVLETLPDAYKGEAVAMKSVLDYLKTSGVDWTFICPAAVIEPGFHTAIYRIGHETLLLDDEGNSRISAEDFADALLTEVEAPRHRRQQMTVAY